MSLENVRSFNLQRAEGGICRTSGMSVASCTRCKVRALAICDALRPEEVNDLDEIVRHVSLDSRTTFIREDDPASVVYTISDGTVRFYRMLADGRRQIFGFGMPSDFIGLTSGGRFTFSADAVTDVALCRMERGSFERLLGEKPHLMHRLHDYATHELVLAQEQMLVIGRRTAAARVCAFLLAMRDRLARQRGPSVMLPLPMSRLDIADYLGLTIETVSRIFSKLARERVILIIPDGIRFLDQETIRRRAED
jgi:CRP/FNR family transcriptional regulator